MEFCECGRQATGHCTHSECIMLTCDEHGYTGNDTNPIGRMSAIGWLRYENGGHVAQFDPHPPLNSARSTQAFTNAFNDPVGKVMCDSCRWWRAWAAVESLAASPTWDLPDGPLLNYLQLSWAGSQSFAHGSRVVVSDIFRIAKRFGLRPVKFSNTIIHGKERHRVDSGEKVIEIPSKRHHSSRWVRDFEYETFSTAVFLAESGLVHYCRACRNHTVVVREESFFSTKKTEVQPQWEEIYPRDDVATWLIERLPGGNVSW